MFRHGHKWWSHTFSSYPMVFYHDPIIKLCVMVPCISGFLHPYCDDREKLRGVDLRGAGPQNSARLGACTWWFFDFRENDPKELNNLQIPPMVTSYRRYFWGERIMIMICADSSQFVLLSEEMWVIVRAACKHSVSWIADSFMWLMLISETETSFRRSCHVLRLDDWSLWECWPFWSAWLESDLPVQWSRNLPEVKSWYCTCYTYIYIW